MGILCWPAEIHAEYAVWHRIQLDDLYFFAFLKIASLLKVFLSKYSGLWF